MISPYVDRAKKPRLIEPPRAELKAVQKRIKTLLGKIEVPDNVFSGIKGRSYSDNARLHLGENTRNLYKIDLTAFFPSISRETVYYFFFEDLCCSPDVAEILTTPWSGPGSKPASGSFLIAKSKHIPEERIHAIKEVLSGSGEDAPSIGWSWMPLAWPRWAGDLIQLKLNKMIFLFN